MKIKRYSRRINIHYLAVLSAFELFNLSCSKGTESKLNSDWSFCHEGLGYSDQAHTIRQPDKDWLCGMPEIPNESRCELIQSIICQGGNAIGPHDVPMSVGAWGTMISGGASVKCLCGCFAANTNIATSDGNETISTLAEAAKFQDVSVLTRSRLDNFTDFIKSVGLRGGDFLSGFEDKKLFGIQTESGKYLNVTSKHPILVIKDGIQLLKQASELVQGDILLEANGSLSKIKSLSLNQSQRVYNFDTKSKSVIGHIVLANGLQVGDNRLQNMLHELEQRVDNRKNGDISYLENILNETN